MIKRILVGVSGTPALDSKIAYSVDLAKKNNARLTLVDVVDVDRLGNVGPVPMGAGHFAEDLVAYRIQESHEISEKAIGKFHKDCSMAGVDVEILHHEGNPLTLLTNLWRYSDLTVIGARGWFDHGVVDEPEAILGQLLSTGVRPILAVPDDHIAEVNKVLVLYNGSLEAAKAIKQFVLLQPYPDIHKVEVACSENTKTGESSDKVLRDVTDFITSHGYECDSVKLGEGDHVEKVLEHVRKAKIDLVVMGCSYHKLLFHKRLGRTTLAMVRQSHIPLFMSH